MIGIGHFDTDIHACFCFGRRGCGDVQCLPTFQAHQCRPIQALTLGPDISRRIVIINDDQGFSAGPVRTVDLLLLNTSTTVLSSQNCLASNEQQMAVIKLSFQPKYYGGDRRYILKVAVQCLDRTTYCCYEQYTYTSTTYYNLGMVKVLTQW